MTTLEKLERIKYHSTKYEVVARHPDAKDVFIMYSARKSRAGLIAGLLSGKPRRIELLAKVTGTRPESWEVNKEGISSGAWKIVLTGRTQHEAYCTGELTETIYQ